MYELVKQLILPPASLILVILVGLVLGRRYRRLGTSVATFGLLALYAAGTPICGALLLPNLERATPPDLTRPPAADPQAIVVLSAGLARMAPEYGGQTVDALTLERLRYGAKLYRETRLPVLVTGGRVRDSPLPLAVLMTKTLSEDFATPVRWVEDRATNTLENATLSAEILRSHDIDTIYLVTHAWHMPRAREAFEQAGIRTVPAPTGYTSFGPMSGRDLLPSVKSLQECYYALHEWIGRVWYRFIYYGQPRAES